MREAEAAAQRGFSSSHLAGVDFVVVSGKVQDAMQDENLQFRSQRMPGLPCLACSRFDGDGQVAGDASIFAGEDFARLCRGKRKHVGGLILMAELAIETADPRITGEQDGDVALELRGVRRVGEKCRKGPPPQGPAESRMYRRLDQNHGRVGRRRRKTPQEGPEALLIDGSS